MVDQAGDHRCEALTGSRTAPNCSLKRCNHRATSFIQPGLRPGFWVCKRHRYNRVGLAEWVGNTDERKKNHHGGE